MATPQLWVKRVRRQLGITRREERRWNVGTPKWWAHFSLAKILEGKDRKRSAGQNHHINVGAAFFAN
jgi:hypothetical protein